tara:strand:+ start:237 stop:437 length:201 start_codon:yes stop_codon:yes gene_type:complete
VKTNKELAREQGTTSRQISKSRKRGYITKEDGTKVRFKAPPALHNSTSKNGIMKCKKGGMKKWGAK